jgi:hypothetical protein
VATAAFLRVPLSTELERKRLVPLGQAAEILAISVDTFKRHHSDLIKTISPRRRGVALGDVLDVAAGRA